MRHQLRLLPALAALIVFSAPAVMARDLSIEERVRAQEAIERVYYSHQTGATRPFAEAAPREALERKVRTYLQQSVALERIWRAPVTAKALKGELDRIARDSRFPGRLQEIYAALGNDSFLVQECFARPVLVDRLTRSFFAWDGQIHADARSEAEALRKKLAARKLDPRAEHSDRSVRVLVRAGNGATPRLSLPSAPGGPASAIRLELGPEEFEKLRSLAPERVGAVGAVVEQPGAFEVEMVLEETRRQARVALYSVPKQTWDTWWSRIQGGLPPEESHPVADGALPLPRVSTGLATESCAPDDAWDNGSLGAFPDPRSMNTAVWTGGLMLIWGGTPLTNEGWRYDPVIDSWSRMSTKGAPQARYNHTAIWTGSRMIVWGGSTSSTALDTGGRYDPTTDTWLPTSLVGAPTARTGHTAIWTGSEMIVYGGTAPPPFPFTPVYFGDGKRYNPDTDTWTPTSPAPFFRAARAGHTAVWTGSEMIVWGGFFTDGHDPAGIFGVDTGGRYNPLTDSWIETPPVSAARAHHRAVWTGSEMIIWGGISYSYDPFRQRTTLTYLNSGFRLNPALNSWTPTRADLTAPPARADHTAIWDGDRMLVWAGRNASSVFNGDVKQYDPATDAWFASSSPTPSPAGRSGHTAIWTGSQMIVWGGGLNTGGRYDPALDLWTPTATSPVVARTSNTAVWTGSLMIVWGGTISSLPTTNTGDRYDPLTDSWTQTTLSGAPAERYLHTAVWTGQEMIVWGGDGFASGSLSSGGRYDPVADSWTPTPSTDAPSARRYQTAVWTGDRMLIWGGQDFSGAALQSGGALDPLTGIWTSTSLAGAPSARLFHTAVWTGDQMIVWGGEGTTGNQFATGGRYDPQSDVWADLPTGAPPARIFHTAVWSGSFMIVWGGVDASSLPQDSGGLYDPASDAWLLTSLAGAPSARYFHTAVWAGNRMIVWGGRDFAGTSFNTGAFYDPVADDWTPTPTFGAPSGRRGPTAVWTGSEMIVWGGDLNSGGRYALSAPTDLDKDGFSVCGGDCEDADPSVNPGAPELCDGLDQNCDGVADDGGDALCDDGNACTEDHCGGAAGCSHLDNPDGTACTDGDACTQVDRCLAGVCAGGSPVICDTGGGCLEPRTCDAPTGVCSPPIPLPDGTACDDGDPCSSNDTCGFGHCQGTVIPLSMTVAVSPSVIQRANHKMVDVTATVNATTSCEGGASVILLSVTSSEPDDAPGPTDGHTVGDIQGTALGTADFNFQVRAEADMNGTGRIYTVVYQASDSSGQVTASATIFVPTSGKP